MDGAGRPGSPRLFPGFLVPGLQVWASVSLPVLDPPHLEALRVRKDPDWGEGDARAGFLSRGRGHRTGRSRFGHRRPPSISRQAPRARGLDGCAMCICGTAHPALDEGPVRCRAGPRGEGTGAGCGVPKRAREHVALGPFAARGGGAAAAARLAWPCAPGHPCAAQGSCRPLASWVGAARGQRGRRPGPRARNGGRGAERSREGAWPGPPSGFPELLEPQSHSRSPPHPAAKTCSGAGSHARRRPVGNLWRVTRAVSSRR